MTQVSQKSNMWTLSDRIDQVFSDSEVSEEVEISEFNFLKKLFGKKNNEPSRDMEDVRDEYDEYGVEDADDEEAIEKTRSSSAPTTHVKSYAIARGKGFLRVAVEGDKNLTKARLHIFKKGDRYFGFLNIPGPGAKAKSEGFSRMLDIVMFEAASDMVLKYDSNNLEDLFDLSNYKDRSALESDKFSQYENEVDILDMDTAKKAGVGRLPWGRQKRQELSGEEAVEIDKSVIDKLSKKYAEVSKTQDDAVYKNIYSMMSELINKISNKNEAESIIDNTKKSIDRHVENGDERSMYKAKIYNGMLKDLSSIIDQIEI